VSAVLRSLAFWVFAADLYSTHTTDFQTVTVVSTCVVSRQPVLTDTFILVVSQGLLRSGLKARCCPRPACPQARPCLPSWHLPQ
jgi:hypothetical protein